MFVFYDMGNIVHLVAFTKTSYYNSKHWKVNRLARISAFYVVSKKRYLEI